MFDLYSFHFSPPSTSHPPCSLVSRNSLTLFTPRFQNMLRYLPYLLFLSSCFLSFKIFLRPPSSLPFKCWFAPIQSISFSFPPFPILHALLSLEIALLQNMLRSLLYLPFYPAHRSLVTFKILVRYLRFLFSSLEAQTRSEIGKKEDLKRKQVTVA